MTTWTNITQPRTTWSEETTNQTNVTYDTMPAYDLDYLTYDGQYILSETDWVEPVKPTSVWV